MIDRKLEREMANAARSNKPHPYFRYFLVVWYGAPLFNSEGRRVRYLWRTWLPSRSSDDLEKQKRDAREYARDLYGPYVCLAVEKRRSN